MRKVKLQMQVSVDGFVAGPNGELDWMLFNWDDVLNDYVTELTDSVDCIIMGRKLAEGFIPYWTNVISNPDDPQFSFGKKMVDKPKIVFTKTLQQSKWANTKLAKRNIADEINELKKSGNGSSKHIIAYGGANFVSGLINHHLIDEYHLFVNPVVLGNGMSIFKNLEKKKLKLIKTTTSNTGIVILCYEPDRK